MEKFLNVDVLETLDAIAEQVLVYGWDNFKYDKAQIIEAAHIEDPGQSILLWICYADGTELYQESDTLVRGSLAYEDVQFYVANNLPAQVPAYYEIEISGEDSGIVRGNIYAMDSHRYAAFTKDIMPIYPADEAQVESVQEFALAELRRMREALPDGTLDVHLENLIQKQINFEAKRLINHIQKMKRPNYLHENYYMTAVSTRFLAKASRSDIDQLMTKLREELHSPSLHLGNMGQTLCIFQHRSEHQQRKPSVKEKLAAKPVPGEHPSKPKNQEAR